jgi:hypothetical protein
MNREDYLRELESAGAEVKTSLAGLLEAANPVSQLRHEVSRDWKWWLPGSASAGLVAAMLLQRPRRQSRGPGQNNSRGPARGGAAYWVPTLLKILPGAIVQLVPLFLSLRSGRKP